MSLKKSVKNYIIAFRPWSLVASTIPALITITYIYFIKTEYSLDINLINGFLALIGAGIFQASSNIINDYLDYKHNVDKPESLGGGRMVVEGYIKPRSFIIYGYCLLLIGIALGIFLTFRSGYHLLWIGAIGVFFTIFYTKFKYISLGDLIIFIIYGPLIGLGTAYVMTNQLIFDALLINIPIALIVVDILNSNNTRDMIFDKKAKIKTPAMRLGLERAKTYYMVLIIAAYLFTVLLIFLNLLHSLSLIVLLSLPIAIRNINIMNKVTLDTLEDITHLDARTSELVIAFGILLSIANFIAAKLII